MPARLKSPRWSKSRSKSPRRVLKRRSSGTARASRRVTRRSPKRRTYGSAEPQPIKHPVKIFMEQTVHIYTKRDPRFNQNDKIDSIHDGETIKVTPIKETFDVNGVTFNINTRENSLLIGEWGQSQTASTELPFDHEFLVSPTEEHVPHGAQHRRLIPVQEFQKYPFKMFTLRVKLEVSASASASDLTMNFTYLKQAAVDIVKRHIYIYYTKCIKHEKYEKHPDDLSIHLNHAWPDRATEILMGHD